MDAYVVGKAAIKHELTEAITDIHLSRLSFDLWTAPNYMSIPGVYGHWISPAGQRMNKLLAFRRVFGKHAGENQAQIVYKGQRCQYVNLTESQG